MATIDDLQETVSGLASEAGASVVGIGHRWAHGSGIVLAEGKVLTNAHNLRGDRITVTFSDGRTEEGRPSAADIDGDVAVVDVDTGDATPLQWADGAADRIGRPVFALANPGGRGLRVTFGLVSGTERTFRGPRGRRITGSIEHTAPLLPGSSGGPIVDASGKLLGINTNRLGEGFYLAIPADGSLKARAEALAAGETPARPRLGIGVAPAHVAKGLRRAVGLDEIDGILIRVVEEGSAADRAGLKEGDLIIAVDGAAVGSPDDLHGALDRATGGGVDLKIVTGTTEREVRVSFG